MRWVLLSATTAVVLTGTALAAGGGAAHAEAPEFVPQSFEFLGAPEELSVPTGACSVEISAWGAAGSTGYPQDSRAAGGAGAKVEAIVPVVAGQTLTIDVGGRGGTDRPEGVSHLSGGYGGGGDGGAAGGGIFAGAGGGKTLIAVAGDPAVIAGGGGGGGGSYALVSAVGGAGGELGLDGLTGSGDGDGAAGRAGGAGGLGGVNAEHPDFPRPNGANGADAVGTVGGTGGDILYDPHGGVGGGGGGAVGGGGGAASLSSNSQATGGGGGGGSSLAPAGSTIATGESLGDGRATLTFVSCPPVPGLALAKRIDRVVDTNDNGITDPGDAVWYSFTATNTGETGLTDLTIVDELLGETRISCVRTDLEIGGHTECDAEAGYELTDDDARAGTLVNRATAVALDRGNEVRSNVADVSLAVSESPEVNEPGGSEEPGENPDDGDGSGEGEQPGDPDDASDTPQDIGTATPVAPNTGDQLAATGQSSWGGFAGSALALMGIGCAALAAPRRKRV